jgi:uncharacterized protein (DUF1800 family)
MNERILEIVREFDAAKNQLQQFVMVLKFLRQPMYSKAVLVQLTLPAQPR